MAEADLLTGTRTDEVMRLIRRRIERRALTPRRAPALGAGDGGVDRLLEIHGGRGL